MLQTFKKNSLGWKNSTKLTWIQCAYVFFGFNMENPQIKFNSNTIAFLVFYTFRSTNALKSLVFWQDEKPWYLKKDISCPDLWLRAQKLERTRKNKKKLLRTPIPWQKQCAFQFFVKNVLAAVSFHDDVTVIFGLILLLNLV